MRDIAASILGLAKEVIGATKVERTRPNSKNDFRLTYDTGSQKWTNDRPGDGVNPDASFSNVREMLQVPSVKRNVNAINKGIQGDSESQVKKGVDSLISDLGIGKTRRVLQTGFKAEKKKLDGMDKGSPDYVKQKKKVDGWKYAKEYAYTKD